MLSSKNQKYHLQDYKHLILKWTSLSINIMSVHLPPPESVRRDHSGDL